MFQTEPARMEDKSYGGACLRLKRAIPLETMLLVQWRFEQFSGVVKYYRSEGREFVVGIQKQTRELGGLPLAQKEPPQAAKKMPEPEILPPKVENRAVQAIRAPDPVATAPPAQIELVVRMEPPPPSARPRGVRNAKDARRRRHVSRIQAGPPPRRAEVKKNSQRRSYQIKVSQKGNLKAKEAGPERKLMKRKWLDLAPWIHKQEGQKEGEETASGGTSTEAKNEGSAYADFAAKEVREIRNEKENRMSSSTQATEKAISQISRETPTFQVELLPMEDIFRAAGITTPRRGYSVTKVVEMISSEHIRGLSKELKRAAVLMALDAAGVAVDQIQRDAKARQDALDIYEAAQKKQAETEWARKAEEIAQIQAELESIKAHYISRINRSTEILARDKARFSSWVTTKEQESRNMAEALDLCLQSSSESSSSSSSSSMAAAAGAGGGNAVKS
jgi:hypothetical protein